jgi:L-iditol 2-dehydrogenase
VANSPGSVREEDTMKRVAMQGGKAWVEECADPQSEKGWVVAKVILSPICGSDKKRFVGQAIARNSGHEGVGVVIDAGTSTLLRNGDRVVLNPLTGCGKCEYCRSGDYVYCEDPNHSMQNIVNMPSHFAEYVKIPDFQCSVVPADLSDELASLAGCAMGPGFSALDRMTLSGLDTLLVTGLGPVGLGTVAIAKCRGAKVMAVEAEEYRRNLARDIGADVVLPPDERIVKEAIKDLTQGRGVLRAVDCSGNATAERLCIDCVGKRGMVAFVGENFGQLSISPSNDCLRKGLVIFGVWYHNLNDFGGIVDVLRNYPAAGKINTHRFGFDRVQEAFDAFMSNRTGKVILDPWA